MIFEIGVLQRLTQCASNGEIFVVFCLDILNRCITACIECSGIIILFRCAFIHDN